MKKHDNLINLFILVVILLILLITILLIIPNNKESIRCVINSMNTLPTNEDVELHIYVRGKNAKLKNQDNLIFNNDYYMLKVKNNDTYTFYVTDGNQENSCSINVNNINKNAPTGKITASTTKKTASLKLTLVATSNVELDKYPYSWDGKNYSNINTLTVTKNGIYTGYIKDKFGNIGTVKYNVTNIEVKANEPKTNNVTIKATGITLNSSSASIESGKSLTLKASIIPNNANDYKITWSSSNSSIATVSQSGIVTAKAVGSTIITAKLDNGVSSSCNVKVISNQPAPSTPTPTETPANNDPIVPSNPMIKYESSTLKYYIKQQSGSYYTYIWMKDPYNQIKKLDSNTAEYGKIMTDTELTNSNKTLVRKTVGEMMNNYIQKGLIATSKGAVGFNASGFYVKGAWNPPDDYYNLRSDSWFTMNEGIVTRNRINDGVKTREIIGIDKNGNLKVYGTSQNVSERQKIYNTIISDKVKNTWSFHPILSQNGKAKASGDAIAKRQVICQMDANNYIMISTINKFSFSDLATKTADLGCKIAFNLDGGGSTSIFYKLGGKSGSTKIKCSDGSDDNQCRSIVEGIYFVEK